MRILVTGGAGFVGSHLVERLLADGHELVVYDNFSTGDERFLAAVNGSSRLRVTRGEMLDAAALRAAVSGCELVYHLAANADVRFGTARPRRDFEQNALATLELVEAMRAEGARRVVFMSTASVYGEPEAFPTPERAPFPSQTSLYGASKLAAEAILQAHAHCFGLRGRILRSVSIIGERYHHGHVLDFCAKLRRDPRRLEVLGDGRQSKSYLYVGDCVEALCLETARPAEGLESLNLGADEECSVAQSIGWICEELGVLPELAFQGGARGWPGDSPRILVDSSRLRAQGWAPRLSIKDGILRTVRWLVQNPWMLERAK